MHEVYLKLGRGPESGWDGRAHFFGAASRAMRQVLVDFARRRDADRRGGTLGRVSLGEADAVLGLLVARIRQIADGRTVHHAAVPIEP